MVAPWRNPDLTNRVRNMIRRGYLVATYTDGKLMKGRVKTGVDIENDKVDIVHPVGYASHIPSGEKVEVITADVNGDPSKRVILAVIGDRDKHPKVAEGESVVYQPGNPKRIMRVNPDGIHSDADDKPMSMKTQKTMSLQSDESMSLSTDKSMNMSAQEPINISTPKTLNIDASEGASLFGGIIRIDSSGNMFINTNLTLTGDLVVNGDVRVNGDVWARDFHQL